MAIRSATLAIIMALSSLNAAYAKPGLNKSFQSKYRTMAHSCIAGQCDDQAEVVDASFFIGARNVHVYAGSNKGLVLPFGQKHVSTEGMSMWVLPTPAGFDESYARDGFTITHHYAVRQDGTCSVSVSVVRAPAKVASTYRTDMESCKVADGNIFAAQ